MDADPTASSAFLKNPPNIVWLKESQISSPLKYGKCYSMTKASLTMGVGTKNLAQLTPSLRKKVEPKRLPLENGALLEGGAVFSLIIKFRNKTTAPAKVALFFKIF